jgi:hypothetical protein
MPPPATCPGHRPVTRPPARCLGRPSPPAEPRLPAFPPQRPSAPLSAPQRPPLSAYPPPFPRTKAAYSPSRPHRAESSLAFRETAALRFVYIAPLGVVLVITGPEEGSAARRGHLRAAHADREHVVDALKAAFVEGRLTKDELDVRAGQALTARTYADLAVLTADIPAGPPAARRPSQPARLRNQPARTPGARNAAVASVGSMVSAFLLFRNGVHLDGPSTRAWLIGAFVFFLVGLILAVGAVVELRRSRGQLPPAPGGPSQPPARQRQASRAPGQSLPAPRRDQNRADARPRAPRPNRPRGRDIPTPRAATLPPAPA